MSEGGLFWFVIACVLIFSIAARIEGCSSDCIRVRAQQECE